MKLFSESRHGHFGRRAAYLQPQTMAVGSCDHPVPLASPEKEVGSGSDCKN